MTPQAAVLDVDRLGEIGGYGEEPVVGHIVHPLDDLRNGPPRSCSFPGFAKERNPDFLLFPRNWIRHRNLLRFARQICYSQAIIEEGIAPDIDANGNLVLDCIADLYQPVRQPVAQAVVIEHRHDDVNVGFELDQALSRIRHRPLADTLEFDTILALEGL